MFSEPLAQGDWLGLALQVGLVLLALGVVLSVIRLIRGPHLIDRIVALDLLAGLAIGFSVILALQFRESAYLNIALCLAFIAFMGTVALARYLERTTDDD
jgi:multicomponent Na+:H+ antiporter subunit F